MSGFGDGPGGSGPGLLLLASNHLMVKNTKAPTATVTTAENMAANEETWKWDKVRERTDKQEGISSVSEASLYYYL